MASAGYCLVLVSFIAAISFCCVTPIHSQTVVDRSVCEKSRIYCPGDHASYKKYCCIQSDGGVQLLFCCNPYLGLYIGVGVGIPTVILIVVGVILCYCCCVRYQNRKMQALIVTYNARRRNRDENAETLLSGPPPYEPLDEETEDKDPELPTYTENDPYAINSPPVAEQSRPEERQEPEESGPTGADSQSTGSDQDSHDHDQQILEDVPLIDESSA